MSSSSDQSPNSARPPQKQPVDLDPQTGADTQPPSNTQRPEGHPLNAHSNLQLKGPPRRPVAPPSPPPDPPSTVEVANPAYASATTTAAETQPASALGQQPIPPPSEPMQYRAIGLVKGKYQPSEEQFNRGILITEDQTAVDAVLLGQVMSLVKKYLDLEQTYLWVVYPRTREKEETLHLQVVGVWSAEGFGSITAAIEETELSEGSSQLLAPLQDGYFSVRGEIVFQSAERNYLLVKIQQSPRKSSDRSKAFKLKLSGNLTDKTLGYFWDLHVQRQGEGLAVVNGQRIALVPPKRKSLHKSPNGQPNSSERGRYGNTPASKPRKVEKPIKRRSSSES
ncbi:MAG: hypothetical protein HC851_00915 [Acaryochloris sp. RU_4_1]|nr:hypothetical protein [Acaryochloris sp. RU_4_1]NJR53609.1 hypothetical protein [Acaryochloris sp. CRU_2_0]